MIQIDDTIISLDVIEKEFSCNIFACKGACCVAGDSGAPLESEEIIAIENAMPFIMEILSAESVKTIEENGAAIIDSDGDLVTPLIHQNECAYVVFTEGIAGCAIEKCWEKGTCTIQKPISCHLYPIRLKKYDSFTAVNYHPWEICEPALKNGRKEKLYIFEFAKSALTRKFGKEWYSQLCEAAKYVHDKREATNDED